jgi:hypothetical protein
LSYKIKAQLEEILDQLGVEIWQMSETPKP